MLPGFRTDLDSLIGAADVVVLPSFTEGLPNVALEASAAGVPVVATAVGGTPEVVADGETGFLVPPGSPTAIAAKVGELLRDPRLAYPHGLGRPRTDARAVYVRRPGRRIPQVAPHPLFHTRQSRRLMEDRMSALTRSSPRFAARRLRLPNRFASAS